MKLPIINFTDGYKIDHRRQYPKGTTRVYSNFTPRSSRTDQDYVVFFGLQYFLLEYLGYRFQETFFEAPRSEVVDRYQAMLDAYLGPNDVGTDHIAALHDLRYLPLRIKALPEGSIVPLQVPVLTIENTHPEFYWLTNFIETMLSSALWGPITSATTAFGYRLRFESYARLTGADHGFVPFQGHDFSFRGLFGSEAAALSGAAHLTSFRGTDTVPAIDFLSRYYYADRAREMVGVSVPATEHAVMCAGTADGEADTFRRLLTEVYPRGIVSVVSDTWDFWGVVTKVLPSLKNVILERDGKLVVRPDSGVPEDILCGDPMAKPGTPERKGLLECLWETFGGTLNEKGYRVLDPHVGAIYGDSITPDRQRTILHRMAKAGFASSNVVLGMGSYTYQYVTRDTYGMAMKATWVEVNGEGREIFKDPATDSGKASARGLLMVTWDHVGRRYVLRDRVSRAEEESSLNQLRTVWENGDLVRSTTIQVIRDRIDNEVLVRMESDGL